MAPAEITHKFEDNAVLMVPVDKLKVHPVNKQIYVSDERRKTELLESIREHGVLEPLIVTPEDSKYLVLSGARRFECAQELGYSELPCLVSIVKKPALAIIEHNRYRQKTAKEIYNEYQLLKNILSDRVNVGRPSKKNVRPDTITGKSIREIASEKLNVSTGYLSMLEQVMENREEIPDVVKRLEAGRETVYSAYLQLRAKKTVDVAVPSLFIGHYFAGKQRLVKDIIARIPDHQCYLEPFGGFCSVLLNKPPSKVEIYNDVNRDVVNLLLCIKECPFLLFSELSQMPYSRCLYEQLIGILGESFEMPNVRRAAQWYYINESTFSGLHSTKQSAGTWRHGVTKNLALELERKSFQLFAVSKRLYRVHLENKDYKYILKHYDGENSFFYLDPPYYQTDDALGISWIQKEHEELNTRLKDLKGKWILTYNDAPEVLDLYGKFKIERVTLPKIASDSKQTGGLREYYNHLIIRNYGEVVA
jgi:DNA adenine methylase